MAPLQSLIDGFLRNTGSSRTPAESERLLSGMARLVDVTSVLAAEIDPKQILSTITQEASKALRCERASLFQFDGERNELFTSFVTELEINEIRLQVGEGVSGHVAQSRTLLSIADPAIDPRWNSEIDRKTGFVTRNILAAPLVTPRDGSLLGVLQLLNRVDGAFDSVDEELVAAFCLHAAVAIDRARLVTELQRRQASLVSLEVARDIQRGFMPEKLPEVPRYESAAWWLSTEEIGGDYCDLLPLKDGRLALVIADVSGHGLGSSLLMASVRAALHAMVLNHSEPEVLLSLLGNALRDDLRDGRFITMLVAALNANDHSFEYANAGHGPALFYDAAHGEFTSLESTGMPLGVVSHSNYPQGWPIEFGVGDIVVLCTDGVVEAMNGKGEQFGHARLQSLIRKHAGGRVQLLVNAIGDAVTEYYDGNHPADDITLLAIRRTR